MATDPDLPASDFETLELPIDTIDAGGVLCRSHRKEHGALHFSVGNPENRFDDPTAVFGVCYMSIEPSGAFVESFLRGRARRYIDRQTLMARHIAAFEVTASLRLARLHSEGLVHMRASARVSAGDYTISQQWAKAIHDHPDQVDGIMYRARHDDGHFSVALFDRARGSVREVSSTPWFRHPILPQLAKRYRFGC